MITMGITWITDFRIIGLETMSEATNFDISCSFSNFMKMHQSSNSLCGPFKKLNKI